MKSIHSSDVIVMIERIGSQFPQMSFRYCFNSESRQHVIDTLPEYLFESREFEEVANLEMVKFGRKFPSENLLFTCKDLKFCVEVAEFELKAAEADLSAAVGGHS